MGKDGSGEPASKKFKQSQLCFKSPRSGNNNLKSKIINDADSENKNNSPKIQILKQKNITDSKTSVLNVSTPLRTDDSSDSSNEEGSTVVKKNDTTFDDKKSSDIDSSDVENVSHSCDTKNRSTDGLVSCSKTISSTTEDISPMEADDTVPSTCVDNGEPESSCSTAPPNGDVENSDSPISKTELDIDTPVDNNACMSPQTPKSSKDDVSLKNDSISSPKSAASVSSDSEDDVSDKATSSSSTPTTPKTPKMKRQMTPKMLQRLEESLKKKQLLEQMKEEKRALKVKQRDEKMKQKVEEEEKKKQLKEEKKKKRLAELELKNEEKRLKQEDKRLKKEKEEEEKNKKKELKLEEQKKEEKKKEGEERRKEAFASFFQKKSFSSPGQQNQSFPTPATSESPTCPAFMPFPMKNDMRLAAVCRRELEDESKLKLDTVLLDNGECSTYLNVLKGGSYTPSSASATWPAPTSEELHDCIIIESQVDDVGRENGNSDTETNKQANTSHRAKLLQFCENRRPAYFGTWTKSSKEISGRKPFTKDTKGVLDYEVDSDSDWEEEEEGEDLENIKDDENEGQEEEVVDGENGYLLDNTFVPHGYLSDEEQPEDEEFQESLEKQKDRLVALREEFDEEMKQGGAQALKPRLLGCLWVSNSTTQVSKGSLYEVLLGHRAVWEESNGSVEVEGDPPPAEGSPNTTITPSTKKSIPPIVMQEIARMVEGSRWPLSKLVREVGEVLTLARPQNPVSRLALTKTIKHIASKTLDSKENSIWAIKPEFRAEYNLQEVEVNTPTTDITPEPRSKGKETLLDTFLKGQQPPAKKRISLTPIPERKDNDKTMAVSPEVIKTTPEITATKKKVAFVTLPPRTPNSNKQTTAIPRTPGPWTSSDGQITIKPHIDTPRPTINRFVNKDIQSSTPSSNDVIELSDDSNI